jgi:hypothetical protein
VDANPHVAETYYSRAKVLMAMSRTYEAAESLKNAFMLDPEKRRDFERDFPAARSLKEFRSLLKP